MSIRSLLLVAVLAVVWCVRSASLAAQDGSASLDVHACDDCHGTHDAAPGRSALVRKGWSSVTPQAPGIGPGSERCLQCHGTAGDREQAELLGRLTGGEPSLLGGSLFDDHPLGTARSAGFRDPLVPPGSTGGTVRDPWGLPGFDADGTVECTSCHDPHETWAVAAQTSSQDETCLSCHDDALDFNSHGIASCGSCHRQHATPNSDFMLRERSPNDLCGACHRGAPPPLQSGIEEIPGSPLHDQPSDPDCKACHTIH
jgi:predicted CXXCH cytochrome family protein